MSNSLPGYDAWKTAGPPEHMYVCPNCGMDSEEMEELEIKGLEKHGLLSYPLDVPVRQDNGTYIARRLRGPNEYREHANQETIYKCDCGLILVSKAFITWEEWHADMEGDDR